MMGCNISLQKIFAFDGLVSDFNGNRKYSLSKVFKQKTCCDSNRKKEGRAYMQQMKVKFMENNRIN